MSPTNLGTRESHISRHDGAALFHMVGVGGDIGSTDIFYVCI